MTTPGATAPKPRLKAPFTDTAIRALPTNVGAYDAGSDGGGLQLIVTAVGSKVWRLHYRHLDTKKEISLGKYPAVSLSEARALREEAKKHLAAGKDPSAVRQAAKRAAKVAAGSTFLALAEGLIAKKAKKARPTTIEQQRFYLARLTPLHRRPIAEIEPPEVLAVLQVIENKGHHSSAHRCRSFAGEVFRFAIASGRAKVNPVSELRGLLAEQDVKHTAAITEPKPFGALLRAVDSYPNEWVRSALRFLVLTGLRSNEVRLLEWSDIDLDDARLTIPAERMKKGREYSAPLSRQAVSLLREQQGRTGRGRLVFVAEAGRTSPMNEATLWAAVKSLGYGPRKHTPHGFRSSFSTMANESGLWTVDAIELCASRLDKNATRRAYNRAVMWDERKRLMQWWASECDKMRTGLSIVRNIEA